MNERYSRRNNDWQYNDQDNSWRFSDQSRGSGRQFESQRSSGGNEWPEQYGQEQRYQNRMGRDYNPSGRSHDFGNDPWGNDNNARAIRGDEEPYGSSSSSSYGLSSGYSGQQHRPFQSQQNLYSGEQFSENQPYRNTGEQQGQRGSSYMNEGPHSDYYRWREQQLKKLDEDYRTWRDERHKRFSEDFDEWRKNRPSTSEPSLSQSSGGLSTSSGSSGGSSSSLSGSGSSTGGSSGSSGSGSGGSSGSKSHEKGSSSSSK